MLQVLQDGISPAWIASSGTTVVGSTISAEAALGAMRERLVRDGVDARAAADPDVGPT